MFELVETSRGSAAGLRPHLTLAEQNLNNKKRPVAGEKKKPNGSVPRDSSTSLGMTGCSVENGIHLTLAEARLNTYTVLSRGRRKARGIRKNIKMIIRLKIKKIKLLIIAASKKQPV